MPPDSHAATQQGLMDMEMMSKSHAQDFPQTIAHAKVKQTKQMWPPSAIPKNQPDGIDLRLKC